jgi:hypothetical protein
MSGILPHARVRQLITDWIENRATKISSNFGNSAVCTISAGEYSSYEAPVSYLTTWLTGNSHTARAHPNAH